jgi:hypothetical protein
VTKYLYANGDSFAFGQELDGPRTPETFYNFSEFQRDHCYSGIIADKWGTEYCNEALPGGSNQRMYRTTMNSISLALQRYEPHEIFVMLSFTHNTRYEFYMTQWKKWVPYMTVLRPRDPHPMTRLWDELTRHYSSPEAEHDYDQLMILGLQNFLRVHRVPYIITSSMSIGATYDDEAKYVPKHIALQRYRPRYFDRPSFVGYIHVHGYERGPELHPLVEGHRAWAEYLLKYIDQYALRDNSDLPGEINYGS